MNTQAGAVAVLRRNDAGQIYWTTSAPLPELPLGVYVPVEALEGLVADWRDQAKRLRNEVPNLRDGSDKRFAAACDADQAADELTQLIKERSNG